MAVHHPPPVLPKPVGTIKVTLDSSQDPLVEVLCYHTLTYQQAHDLYLDLRSALDAAVVSMP
jgi:hypothetical protein